SSAISSSRTARRSAAWPALATTPGTRACTPSSRPRSGTAGSSTSTSSLADMLSFVVKRLLAGIPTLFGVTLITFLLFHAFGGNPAYEFLGKNAKPAEVEVLTHEFGLDRPLYAQYLAYLQEIATMDFGRSFVTHRPVRTMLLEGLEPSLSLTVPALLITTL